MSKETKNINEEITAIVRRENLADQQQSQLVQAFQPFHARIEAARRTSETITNGADPLQRKMARECRLELRRVRCEVETTRKATKGAALRYGKAVDGMANILKLFCEPEEKRLEEIEEHEARIEAARIAALVEERTAALVEAEGNPAAFNLGAMDDATWDTVIESARKAKADRIESERKAEADRIAREKAAAEERERIQQENERLKAEAEKREVEIKAEREKAEKAAADAAKKAAAERAKIEAEAKAERDKAEVERRKVAAIEAKIAADKLAAEQKAAAEKAAAEKAAKKAAAAPDRDKLLAVAAAVMAVGVPAMATDDGKKIAAGIEEMKAKMANWINTKVGEL